MLFSFLDKHGFNSPAEKFLGSFILMVIVTCSAFLLFLIYNLFTRHWMVSII